MARTIVDLSTLSPQTVLRPTKRARDACEELKVEINEVCDVVRLPDDITPARKPNQSWRWGETQQGKRLKVLVERVHEYMVDIITLHEITEGGD